MEHPHAHEAKIATEPKPGCCAHHPKAAATPSALKDPVCGMDVTTQSRHSHIHAQQSYYFCSASCQTKFAADPQKYLAPATPKVEEPAGQPASLSVQRG